MSTNRTVPATSEMIGFVYGSHSNIRSFFLNPASRYPAIERVSMAR